MKSIIGPGANMFIRQAAYAGSILWSAFFFSSPAMAITIWDLYEACPSKPFVKMLECGSRSRLAYCKKNTCTPEGKLVMQYADNLAAAVRRGEMSESQAERDWIDFQFRTQSRWRQEHRARRPEPYVAPKPSIPSTTRRCTFTQSGMLCHDVLD